MTRASATQHPRWILATTILASSLAFVDGSVVNVGLPAIGKSLDADAAALQWVINGYLLPLSALLLLGGGAGDRFGRRLLLIAGTALFAAASLACALAPNLPVLIASRFVQGIGAAILMPNSLAILGATFQGESKGRAVGIWAAAGAGAAALGPVLGGWLIDLGNWRAIFLLNLPLAAGAMLLGWRFLPADQPGDDEPLDLLGGTLATLALGALTWALTVASGPDGWTLWAAIAAGVSLPLFAVFLLAEHARRERAMMPLALFTSRSFVGLSLLTLLLYGALGGMFVLIPYALMTAGGYSSTAAGAALLPLPIILSLVSPLAGALAGRIGSRLPLAIGPVVVGLGFLLMTRIENADSYWSGVFPAIIVIALGLTGAVAPLTTAVLSSVDARHSGSASGFNSAISRTGGLVATALLGSVLAAQGDALWHNFRVAMVCGALACFAAGACAFVLLEGRKSPQSLRKR